MKFPSAHYDRITGKSRSKKEKTTLRQIITRAVAGQSASIVRGRSSNRARCGSGTPVCIIAGAQAPLLCGQPYLKTQFRRGTFAKTLYTPSSLRVEVGAGWLREAARQEVAT